MDGVLLVFRSFDSWTARTSISELKRWSRSSKEFWTNTVSIPLIDFSLLRVVEGTGWEGSELVGTGSTQFVGSDVQFCWMLVHFPHFQRLSRVEAFGPVLHFWWNPLEHTLHFTGTVLERRAAEHLAHFSFEFFASARDNPWFSRDVNEGGVGCGGELLANDEWCDVADGEVADGVAEWRWQCQILVERARGLAFPLGYTNPLHVAARWQTLPQDGFAQW